MPSGKIALLVEHDAAAIRSLSYETANCGLALARATGWPLVAVTLGDRAQEAAGLFAERTGIDTIAIELSVAGTLTTEMRLSVLSSLLTETGATIVLVGNSALASELVPGLAVALRSACVTALEALHWQEDHLRCRRMTHSGKIVTEIVVRTDRAVLSIQPGSFSSQHESPPRKGTVICQTVQAAQGKVRHLEYVAAREADLGLAAADVIVSAGRGLGRRENVELVRRIAALFPKGTIAGSRPVCDAGWLPGTRQVGQTGAVVRPKVYIACGISGATQHLLGMKESGFIVAINQDRHAPIFRYADVGVVEDVVDFLPRLAEEIERAR